ncbi:hypothetical protein ACWC10_04740 [Streptomyces sp. NPDC001595]|uniref:hypothetical protein n=1 Tax=Streptomyces sp. NPDC001532 TaxID=3154520 RepID=UPI0033298356
MGALKRWLDRSLLAQTVLLFPLAVGIAALFRRDASPVIWVIQGALYTAIGVTVMAVQRRKASREVGVDPREIGELNRRIRRREVPKDPEERAILRRLVDQQLGQMERGGRWLPYWLGFMGLVAVGMLVLGALSGSLLFPVLFAIGVIVFCVWVLWMRRHAMDRARSMRSALKDQEQHDENHMGREDRTGRASHEDCASHENRAYRDERV